MDAYRAVISLHNLGYQLKALEEDQVAIKPAVKAEQAELIKAIRDDPKAACRAIQYLPQLCVMIIPGCVKEYAATLFGALKENGQAQIVRIIYCRSTGETEWVFISTDAVAHKAMLEIMDCEWKGVKYLECEEEGQRWGTRTGGHPAQPWT